MKEKFYALFDPIKMLKKHAIEGDLPTSKDVFSRTMFVAKPSMIETFLVAIISMVDTLMVSQLGDYAITAVGLTGQPRLLCLCFFFSINAAVSALVARRKGENNKDSANKVLGFAFWITVVLIIIVSLLSVIFAREFMYFSGALEDTIDASTDYFSIIMGGMIFNVLSMVINAAQRGAGNTRISMRTNLTANLVNVVLNYLLIGGNFGFPALGIKGAAIATVLGTVVALFMSILSLCKKDAFLTIGAIVKVNIDKFTAKSMLTLTTSTLAEQVFARIGFMTFAIIVAKLGTTAFATHQIGMNLLTISFSIGDGLSVASVALVGQSLGEKRVDLARIYAKSCKRIGIMGACVLSIIYITMGRFIFSWFSDSKEVLDMGFYLSFMIAGIIFMQILQVITSGSLRGAGDTKYIAIVSLVSIAILRPLSGWLFCYPFGWGLIGVWLSLALDQFVRLLLTTLRFNTGKWTSIKI